MSFLKLVPLSLLAAVSLASACAAAPRRPASFQALHKTERPSVQLGKRLWSGPLKQGATPRPEGVRFVIRSQNATRVELEVYGQFEDIQGAENAFQLQTPEAVYALTPGEYNLWVADIPNLKPGTVYGYRVWGPNWTYDPSWVPGSDKGFLTDVDSLGHRFNPNKLLIDPIAKALTRDPYWKGEEHASGEGRRYLDSAATQAKSIVVQDTFDWSGDPKKRRMLKDSVIYEVNVRGMTKLFPDIPHAGTYKALAHPKVIQYLKNLGVTTVELLPVHEASNDWNDENPEATTGKNYWGYMTLSYFAPDRRFSSDQSAQGPVREFKQMVKDLHKAGLEVLLDVVYNHHTEGGVWNKPGEAPQTATLLSLRGVDNAMYYQLAKDRRYFKDNTGIGANLRTAAPEVQEFLLHSMKYWVEEMGVDGFRFDLCAVLGNSKDHESFSFQKMGGFLDRIAKEFGYHSNEPEQTASLPKLVAEPWAIFDDTYQLGNFPQGWAEWNGKYRDTLRRFMKGKATGREMRDRMAGSYDLFGDDGRQAYQSINFFTAHDGLTLNDLVSYNVNSKEERDQLNLRPWPLGPSDGGEEHNTSWNSVLPGQSPLQTASLRRQRARQAMATLMMSNGTPMILGGDERLRTKHGNNNTYNLDNATNWLHWDNQDVANSLDQVVQPGSQIAQFQKFSQTLIRLRRAHPSFHRSGWWNHQQDRDNDGYPGVVFQAPQGGSPDEGAAFGMRLDASREDLDMDESTWNQYPLKDYDLFVAINGSPDSQNFKLPKASPGTSWVRLIDTAAWAEAEGNTWSLKKATAIASHYDLVGRSVAVFLERPHAR